MKSFINYIHDKEHETKHNQKTNVNTYHYHRHVINAYGVYRPKRKTYRRNKIYNGKRYANQVTNKLKEVYYDHNSEDDFKNKTWSDNTDMGRHVDRLHGQLDDHYGRDHRYTELNDYTQESEVINSMLHKHHEKGTDPTKKKFLSLSNTKGDFINSLDSILDSKESPSAFHVYTGIQENPHELLEKDRIRGLVKSDVNAHEINAHLPAYTSTSLHPTVARTFASYGIEDTGRKGNDIHILKIEIPKGTKHGFYVGHNSEEEHEREFLMKRGKNIKISAVPQKMNIGEHDVHIWHTKLDEE